MSTKSFMPDIPDWPEMKCEAILYELADVEIFDKLSDDQKTKEWNGIGPDRYPKWARKLLSNLYRCVLPAACIHDFEFVIGGTKDEYHASNKRLKKNMKTCLKHNRQDFTLVGYWLGRLQIHFGCMLVDKLGWEGWHKPTVV